MKMYKPFKIKSSGGSPAGYGEGSSEADVSLVGKRPENESEGVMSRFARLVLDYRLYRDSRLSIISSQGWQGRPSRGLEIERIDASQWQSRWLYFSGKLYRVRVR